MENKHVNWEKISVYLAITVSLLTVIIYLFQIKDDISGVKERVAKTEVKIEKLEEK
jgi:hypothetical protein